MILRVLATSAVAVYLAVVGCVVTPGGTNRPTDDASAAPAAGGGGDQPVRGKAKLVGLPLRGVAMTVNYGPSMDPWFKCIDEIADVGANTLEIVVSGRMENGSSTQVFIDQRMTPTREQILSLFAKAKTRNLKVMLMPIVLLQTPRGNEWRGTIKPELWAEWFESYRGFITYYAEMAAAGKIDAMVVGSELVSTEVHDQEWSRTIAAVRAKFDGMLTYSSNWDHYHNIPFWEKLDFIGMNSYWALGENNKVTVPQIKEKWSAIQKDLANFSRQKNMPIVLCEVGWCSISNAANEPWDYTQSTLQPDLDLQRRLYEAFFESWYGNPNLGGFMVWEWHPYPMAPDDKTYNPKGKPAFDVLKHWMAKPAWEGMWPAVK